MIPKFSMSSWILWHSVLALVITTLVNPSPISNQVGRNRSYVDPGQIIYPNDTANKTPQSKPHRFCAGVNGTRLAANLDENGVTCHELGQIGPCPRNMKFYAVPGKYDLGMCDCDQELNGVVYNELRGQCDQLHSQDSCEIGEWLQLTTTGDLTCLPNPCWNSTTNSTDASLDIIVRYNEHCTNLYEKCTSKDGSLGHVGFDSQNQIRCLILDTNYSLSNSIPHLKCSPGSRWSSLTNSCRKAIKFDFS